MSRRSLHYLAPLLGVAPLALLFTVGTATAQESAPEPDSFTSAFRVQLSPDQVVDNGGTSGASGTFDLRLNSDEEVLCYDITTTGVNPPFMSPARTATHIHEADRGTAGPARIVFPNPEGGSSSGCLSVPTTVGLMADGSTEDTGAGFSLEEIEADPSEYYADVHTEMSPKGAVRGQFGSAVPVGGLDTGAGGTTTPNGPSVAVTAGLVLAAGGALAGAGIAVRRRA